LKNKKTCGIIIPSCKNNNRNIYEKGEINMRKTNLIKVFLTILLGVVLIGTTAVFADNEYDYIFDDPAEENTTNTNTNTNKSNTNTNTSNNTNTNKSNTNTNNTNTNSNKNTNTNNTNTNKNTNNSSVYNNANNTNLPKTGVEDSIPTMVLVVVFGISAVYAYKKISEYKNV